MSTAKLSPLFFMLQGLFESKTIEFDGEPYLTRFFVKGSANTQEIGEPGQVFIHFFHKSDQHDYLHNHPYVGTSIMLAGGYTEELIMERTSELGHKEFLVANSRDFLPGDVHTLALGDYHRTTLLDPENGCWTLFVTGERVKDWGFLNRNTFEFTAFDPSAPVVRERGRQVTASRSAERDTLIPTGDEDTEEHALETESFVPALAVGTKVTFIDPVSRLHRGVFEVVEPDHEDSHMTYRIAHTEHRTCVWASLGELCIYLEPENDPFANYELPVHRSILSRIVNGLFG